MSLKNIAMKFDFPTSWQHGRGLAAESGRLLKDLGCKTTLVVTDKLLVDLGILKPITTSLDAFHITYTVCDEVTIEPTVSLFDHLVNKLDLKKFFKNNIRLGNAVLTQMYLEASGSKSTRFEIPLSRFRRILLNLANTD